MYNPIEIKLLNEHIDKRLFWMAVCCLPFISLGCKQSETAVKESSISDALYQNLPLKCRKYSNRFFLLTK